MIELALAGWIAGGLGLALSARTRRDLRSRRVFSARACHELRGALATTQLGLELEARAGHLAGRRWRALQLELERAAAALEDLSSGCASGPSALCRPPSRQEMDMYELLADSLEVWAPLGNRRQVELRLEWSGPRASVLGDRARLVQLLDNLIGNAVEHGAGPVRVAGRLSGQCIRIEVHDQGPGLGAPLAELAGRGARQPRRRGHGLAIALAVAQEHGGQLAAAPSHRGARLVLELPAGGSARAGGGAG